MPANPARRLQPAIAGLAVIALTAAVMGAVLGAGESHRTEPGPLPEAGRAAWWCPGRSAAASGSFRSSVRQLPLERKVAQLFVLGFEETDATAELFGRLRRLDAGGILIGRRTYVDPAQLTALAKETTAVARRAGHLRPFVLASKQGGELNAIRGLCNYGLIR